MLSKCFFKKSIKIYSKHYFLYMFIFYVFHTSHPNSYTCGNFELLLSIFCVLYELNLHLK